MKLEDIKNAVRSAALAELKRSYYNAAAVVGREELMTEISYLYAEVFEVSGIESPADLPAEGSEN